MLADRGHRRSGGRRDQGARLAAGRRRSGDGVEERRPPAGRRRGVMLRRTAAVRGVVTPNIPEAEILSGRRIASIEDARAAAFEIHQSGASAVVITGGHAPGDADRRPAVRRRLFTELHTTRIDTPNTHGTGCTFASAIAAYLALGHPVLDAVVHASGVRPRRDQARARHRPRPRPLDHFWRNLME